MKKIIASAGLVAVSATGLYAQDASAESRMATTKPWTVSAALRGFYDDNVYSAPNLSNRKLDSWGIEVRPGAALNLRPDDQTTLSASCTYGMKWYEARSDNSVDQSVEADLGLTHAFSPQYKGSLTDSFLYTQEPELIEPVGNAPTVFLRQNMSAIRNRGSVEFSGKLTDLFGFALGYENGYYDFLGGTAANGSSLATVLNRIEHTLRADARWQARPDLVALVGYQYGRFDYTDDSLLQPGTGSTIRGTDRDSQSHYVYLGGEYSMTQKLSAKARAGAIFTTYDRFDISSTSPFADVSVNYTYLPGDTFQLGVRQERNATDMFTSPVRSPVVTQNSLVLDQDSTTVYATVAHKITSRVTGSVLGQYSRSVFNGGDLNNEVDNFFTLGLNLQYKITPMFSVEGGYNWDRLDSDLGSALRSFTRNRVYVGLRATY